MGRRTALALLLLTLLAREVAADGFHSPLLREGDPKEWAVTVRAQLGLDRSGSIADGGGEARDRGGHARRAQAPRLVQALRYLDRRNIRPAEFPAFNLDSIPGFRTEIEKILIEIGEDAVPLLVKILVTDLVTGARNDGGLAVAKKFLDRVEYILIAIGEPSVYHLVDYLDHESDDVRAAAIRIVRAVGRDRVSFGTKADLWKLWATVMRIESQKPADAVSQLVPLLRHGHPQIESEALRVLGVLRRPAATTALRDYAELHRDSEKRLLNAIRALGMCGSRSSAPLFVSLLEDGRVAVRREAVTALRFLARRSFGFEPTADPEKRSAAVRRWREWVK